MVVAVRRTVLLAVLIWGSLAAAAQASNLVFVCGKDLCSANADGSGRLRLTHDGAAGGAYSSPSLSRPGKRIAYTRGERGRVFTARLIRRAGRIRGLRGVRRIPPFRDGARDATQFDVALSPDGSQVAWVELRINVVFSTIDYRRYAARFDGSGSRQVAASGGRPFVAWGSASRTLREGLTIETDDQQTGESPDSGLCIASPGSAQNGTCRGRVRSSSRSTRPDATCAIRTSSGSGSSPPPTPTTAATRTTRSSGPAPLRCSTRPPPGRSAT